MQTKKEAEKAGQEMLAKMKDPNWKLRVWENLGWHCEIQNGPLSVSYCPNSNNQYLILMSDDPLRCGTGAGIWTLRGKSSFKDPIVGLKKQIKEARKVADVIMSAVTVAESILNKETK